MIEIASSNVVPAAREVVFAFLADPRNHWELSAGKIELLELGDDGSLSGVVRIRGPLRLARRARTRVISFVPPAVLAGMAEIGARTLAEVRWDLSDDGSRQTRVSLSARVLSLGMRDRLLLALGGRRWMQEVFASTLRLLAEQLGADEDEELAQLEVA